MPPGQCPPQLQPGELGRSVMDGDADTRTECASTRAEGFRQQQVRTVGDRRRVPGVQPSVVGRCGRADQVTGETVGATQEPELDAGGVRGGSTKQGRSGQRRPLRRREHARGGRRIMDGDANARTECAAARAEGFRQQQVRTVGDRRRVPGVQPSVVGGVAVPIK